MLLLHPGRVEPVTCRYGRPVISCRVSIAGSPLVLLGRSSSFQNPEHEHPDALSGVASPLDLPVRPAGATFVRGLKRRCPSAFLHPSMIYPSSSMRPSPFVKCAWHGIMGHPRAQHPSCAGQGRTCFQAGSPFLKARSNHSEPLPVRGEGGRILFFKKKSWAAF